MRSCNHREITQKPWGQQRSGKPAALAPEHRAVGALRTQAVLGPPGDWAPLTLTAASDEVQVKVN